jgi:hypothetical protein
MANKTHLAVQENNLSLIPLRHRPEDWTPSPSVSNLGFAERPRQTYLSLLTGVAVAELAEAAIAAALQPQRPACNRPLSKESESRFKEQSRASQAQLLVWERGERLQVGTALVLRLQLVGRWLFPRTARLHSSQQSLHFRRRPSTPMCLPELAGTVGSKSVFQTRLLHKTLVDQP